MAKWKATYDTDKRVPNQGYVYMHCGECLDEFKNQAPGTLGQSPASYARQQLAITKEGRFQLWCTRHDINIALIKIEEKGKGEDGSTEEGGDGPTRQDEGHVAEGEGDQRSEEA